MTFEDFEILEEKKVYHTKRIWSKRLCKIITLTSILCFILMVILEKIFFNNITLMALISSVFGWGFTMLCCGQEKIKTDKFWYTKYKVSALNMTFKQIMELQKGEEFFVFGLETDDAVPYFWVIKLEEMEKNMNV